MFAFICPVRHPNSTDSYNEVLNYLELTIESVCSQETDKDFIFVVVCNERPEIEVDESIVKFHIVDFDVPDTNKGSEVPLEVFKLDKGNRIASGLLFLKNYAPDYVYIIDADDWVNVNIVNYVYKQSADLLFTNSAYVINLGQKQYVKKYGVCRYCGSTFIYKYSALMDVTGLNKFHVENPNELDLKTNIDNFRLKNILGNHRYQVSTFRMVGLKLHEIKIPSCCWILNTGQNHSNTSTDWEGKPLSTSLLNQFGIRTLKIRNKKPSIKQNLSAFYISFLSLIGWLSTNKKEDKL